MAFFDKVYDRLFQSSSSQAPLVFEPLTRGEAYAKGFQDWKRDVLALRLRDISSAIILKQRGIIQDIEVHLLNGTSFNGLAISFSESFQKKEFSYLLDYLAEKVKTLPYKLVNADYLLREKPFGSEGIEKYYFKPLTGSSKPFDQKFGNILFEHVAVNGQSSYLKISANTYNDQAYQIPENFEQLLEHLIRI